MKGKLIFSCLLGTVLILSSCTVAPEPVALVTPAPQAAPAETAGEPEPVSVIVPEVAPVAEPFDPASISKEEFDTTKTEVQALIEELNTIIRAQDFEAWSEYLGTDYFAALSDPAFWRGSPIPPV